MESIPQWIGDLSVLPVIATFWWLVASGRMIPKATMDTIIAQYDKMEALNRETITMQAKQAEQLYATGETTRKLLESVKEAATGQVSAGPHDET